MSKAKNEIEKVIDHIFSDSPISDKSVRRRLRKLARGAYYLGANERLEYGVDQMIERFGIRP
jgi:hypothetical protein